MIQFSTLLFFGFLSAALSSPAINLNKHFFAEDESGSGWDIMTERNDEVITPDLKVTSQVTSTEATLVDWSPASVTEIEDGPSTFSPADFLESELSIQSNFDKTTTIAHQPVLTTSPSAFIRGVMMSTSRPTYGI